MKRIYKTPSILIVKLASKHVFMENLSYRITNDESDDHAWVKEDVTNSSSSSNYNVWDDDWSK